MKKPCRSKRQRKKLLKKAGLWLTPEQAKRFREVLRGPSALWRPRRQWT